MFRLHPFNKSPIVHYNDIECEINRGKMNKNSTADGFENYIK